MYKLTLRGEFASAHWLDGYQGACASLHGHTWKLAIVLQSPQVRGLGMVVDFKDMKRVMGHVLAKYDHQCLNDVIEEGVNPTAENLSRILYKEFEEAFQQWSKDGLISLKEVTIWESDYASCTYTEEEPVHVDKASA